MRRRMNQKLEGHDGSLVPARNDRALSARSRAMAQRGLDLARSLAFVQWALNREALWTAHDIRADGAKSLAQRRVDRLRKAIEAGDSDAIDALIIAVETGVYATAPFAVGRDQRDVPASDRELCDFSAMEFFPDWPGRTESLRTALAHRDAGAIRLLTWQMRYHLQANARRWLQKKGIRMRLRD